jgi:hypothetical protein
MKIGMGLASWRLLGAFLAAFVGFGAYMYGGLATSSAAQAGVGEYVIPAFEAAQPKQQSEEPSKATKNSSLSTEAAEHALSAGDILPISNGSGFTEQRTGSAVPTETPSSAPPLPVQAAGVSTLADSCTSQVWCANPAQQIPSQAAPQIPNQGNVPTETASSSTGDNGEDSSSKKKPSKEKSKKNNKGKKK